MPYDLQGKEPAFGKANTWPIVLLASGAQTAPGTGAVVVEPAFDHARAIALECVVTAQSGTAPTLDLDVEASLDFGTTWYQLVRFSQYAAATGTKLAVARLPSGIAIAEVQPVGGPTTIGTGALATGLPWGDRLRVQFNIGGTTPSFTLQVNAYPFYGFG